MEEGVRVSETLKPTFTKILDVANPNGQWVCSACLLAMHEKWPVKGREKLQKLRNYGHYVTASQWRMLQLKSKDPRDRRFAQKVLVGEHKECWACVLAVSGQKHLLYHAPVNLPGERRIKFLLEEETCECLPQDLRKLLKIIEDLGQKFQVRDTKTNKGEVSSGRYDTRKIVQFGADQWERSERELRQWRGTVVFDAACYLAVPAEEGGEG